jgi:hypothetical protein
LESVTFHHFLLIVLWVPSSIPNLIPKWVATLALVHTCVDQEFVP